MAPNLNNRERFKLYEEGFNVFSKIRNLVKYLKEKKKNPTIKRIVYDPKKEKKERKKHYGQH